MATARLALLIGLLAALALVPPVAGALDEPFYVVLFSRMLILAIGAVGLNLVMGYGGMVSFGHAAFVGVGAYVVGIGSFHAIEDGLDWFASGFVQFPLALLASGLFALVFGAISLRTKGVYFIMITLAFSQMLYFVAVGVEYYGADDGLSLYGRSEFAGIIDLGGDTTLYYLNYAVLLACLYLVHRMVNSRFGMTIQGARANERRMQAVGFPTYPYRLVAFVISGMICGTAGFLLANQTDFVSPDMMHWTRSGDLIIMVVLGGMGTLFGPVVGAVAFLLIEEILSSITVSWQLFFGPMLILVVLFARGGIVGLLKPRQAGHG